MTPVTAALCLRDLGKGKTLDRTVPFLRVVKPAGKEAQRLFCASNRLAHLIALHRAGRTG